MMLYKDNYMYDTLTFDDVFKSPDEFETKVDAIASKGSDTLLLSPYADLYYILMLKYAGSHTRYTDEFQFIIALIRELRIAFPIYKLQKSLMEDMMEMEIAEVMKNAQQIRNLVNDPNELNTSMDETPITTTSSEQESILQVANKLDAIKDKYSAISRNYQRNIYNSVSDLFRTVLAEDQTPIYDQEGE